LDSSPTTCKQDNIPNSIVRSPEPFLLLVGGGDENPTGEQEGRDFAVQLEQIGAALDLDAHLKACVLQQGVDCP